MLEMLTVIHGFGWLYNVHTNPMEWNETISEKCVCVERKMDAFIYTFILKLWTILGSSMYLGVFCSPFYWTAYVHYIGIIHVCQAKIKGKNTRCISNLDAVLFSLFQVTPH